MERLVSLLITRMKFTKAQMNTPTTEQPRKAIFHAVVVEEYVEGHHPYADDCDLVVLAPLALKDLASQVTEKLQFAATGESRNLEYEDNGRICFMVTHA